MSSSFPVDEEKSPEICQRRREFFAGPVEELPPYDPEGSQAAVAVFWNAKKAAFLV